ncbi:toprim domain-containing protein [Helicobacter sp. MIT 21-1697]|uniref:toprim domain-containing protein n=1 Tax=Helicobacter sp. MIT 21-1697 TaxID=2993733 RepID=UPI00224A95C1|nr:toprim domain-containing protein [Helicobacter sp. MIT 21-1697]MCX2716831.1 toprim domain-containing protein [Helicobacter sp. MIT 21-1697]
MPSQDLTKLPLHEILLANGFEIDRNKSSKNYPALINKDKDIKIIVSKKGENYLYFNRHDDFDRGNIISFARNHGYDLHQMVANFDKSIHTAKHYNHNFFSQSHTQMSELNALKSYKNFTQANVKDNKLLELRGFDKEFLTQYQGFIKEDTYHNIIIPNYKLQHINKDFTDENRILLGICGYTKRLSLPITQDREGNQLDKPIKNIQYGSKGIEILNINKESNDIQNIIITESIFDSLSFAQIKDYKANETMLLSTAGQFSENTKQGLEYLIKKAHNAKITLAFDNDEKGQTLSQNMQKLVFEAKKQFPIVYTPFCKDCNDDLKLRNITGLQKLNKHTYKDWIDMQILKYGRINDTQKNANLLKTIRKADTLKALPKESKEAFNKKPKHKAIKSL